MVSSPQYSGNKIKFIQLSEMETGKILCVVVLDGNLIKNQILECEEEISKEDLLKFNVILNTSLAGLTAEQVNVHVFTTLASQIQGYQDFLKKVFQTIVETFASEKDLEIYTSGATNIFKYPELSDKEKASELIYTLEEKKQLATIIADSLNEENNTGIQVYIGNETPVKTMKDCSVVTATYELGEGVRGSIGIIGPKRMDYERVVEILNTVKSQLDGAFDHKK